MEDKKSSSLERLSYDSADSLEVAGPGVTVTNYLRPGQGQVVDTLEVRDMNAAPDKRASYTLPASSIFSFSRKKATIVSAIITAIVVGLTGVSALVLVNGDDEDISKSNLSGINAQDANLAQPSSDVIAKELQGTQEAVLVNGDLITRGILKVVNGGFTTIIQSQNNTADQSVILPNSSGTLCLDTNNCNFVTQNQINSLTEQLGQIIIPTYEQGVDSLNGQKGALSIQGTSNQISVVMNGAVVTLATPQDIAPISSPTFSNLLLNNNFTVNGTITTNLNCTGNLNGGLLTANASGQIICGDDDGGAGAGVSTAGGTSGRIALFTGAQTIADSIISEALGTITVSGALSVTGSLSANSLSLSTALGVANGGTGAVSFTSNGVLIGNGPGALTATAAPSAAQVLIGNAGGVPVFVGLSGDISVSAAGVTSVQANSIDLGVDTTGNYVASLTAGNGISVGVAGEAATPSVALSALTADWSQTGAFDIVLNNANSELRVLESTGATFFGTFDVGDLTANRAYTFPDADGTVCLNTGNCVGGSGGAPNNAGYLTVGNDGTLSGERAITAGSNLSATDGGANGLYTLNVVSNPTFTGQITANGGVNIATQTLQGTTAVIDFTNFDVSSTGNVTAAGTVTANSLTLSSALTVSNGGTGATTFTTNGLLYGNGTAAISSLAAPTSGQLLLGNASGVPTFTTVSGDIAISSTGVVTIQGDSIALGTDTVGNYVASITAGNGISASGASEGGSPTIALAALTANWNQTGAFDVLLSNATSELRIMESAGGLYYGSLDVGDLTSDRTYTFPDADGTICLDTGNCVGGSGGAPNNAAYLTVGNNATLSGERAITAGTNLSASDGGANSTYTFNVVSNPTFSGLITANGGVSLGTQTLQGTTAIIDFSNFDLDSSGNLTAGTLNGQTISSSANFTGSVTVATNLSVNGNVTVGDASSDTLTLNGTIQGGTPFVLEGATANAHQITIAVADPTADRTYTIPFVGSNADFCLSTGNCAGSGGGVTTSGGTTNRVAKFAGSQSLADSTISDDGTNVSITGDFIVQGGNITFGTSSQVGSITLHDGDGETVTLNVPDVATSYSLLLPGAVGGANQCLKAQDGSGTLFWDDCTGGAGGGSGIATINGQSGPSITINNASGSGNAVTINNAAADGSTKGIAAFNATNFTAGSGVINTAQNINTAAAPTFAGLSLTGNLQVNNNTIQGGTAAIDYTNFDVSSGGAITAASISLATALTVANGGTGTTTLTTNGILYGNGTGAIQATAAAADSILATNGSNVPGLTQTLPTTVQGNITTVGTITSGIWNGTALVDTYVSDTLTVGASSTVEWSALNNYPAACSAGQAITQLGDTITCTTFAAGSGSGNYIQNQNAAQQTAADFWISGSGRADGSILTPTIDVATAGTLSIGSTTATAVTIAKAGVTTTVAGSLTVAGTTALNDNTTLATGKYLRITGDATAGRPASPGEGALFFDQTTKQLLVYGNGKWQADRTEAILVAASNSSQADKDAADYVGDGNTGAAGDGDQVQVNSALTAGAGKTVVLLAGTYTFDDTANVPNNTVLSGVGDGTLIVAASGTGALNLVTNSDTTTGTGVVVQDMRLDGNKLNRSGGTEIGINFSSLGIGGGSGVIKGGRIQNVHTSDFDDTGISIDASVNTFVLNSTAKNSGYGIMVLNGSNNTVSNNMTSGNTEGIFIQEPVKSVIEGNTSIGDGTGVDISNVSGITFTGNVIYGSTATGLNISEAYESTFNSNSITYSASDGVYINGPFRDNTFTNNIVSFNSQNGIALNYGVEHNSFIGNTMTQNTQDGFLAAGAYSNTFTGNNFYTNGGRGLVLNTADYNTVTGNNFSDNNSTNNDAIYLTAADNNTITGNTIRDLSFTGTNYAINISDAASDANYLADNTLGGGSINNTGTGTIYGGQLNVSGNYVIDSAGSIDLQSNTNITGTLAVSALTTLSGGLTVTNGGNVAFQQGTAFSTTGSSNDVNLGSGALFRLTGASAQTITGIAGGTDGRMITLVNAAGQAATLSNESVSSTAANRIVTGTASDLSLAPGASIGLTYDSSSSRWRVIGGVAGGNGTCSGCANTSLSNLSGVSINASLTPNVDNTLDLGSSANSWRTLYADTSVLTPTLDVATAGTLTIGGTATAISIADDTTIAAGKYLRITGDNTAGRPASPSEGMLFFDTTTKQLLVYNGTKWVSDRSTATKIVAAGNSSQAAKDGADYVADGEAVVGAGTIDGDQAQINAAIAALPASGGSVYLTEGTYYLDASIVLPSNVKLSGAGASTIITVNNTFGSGVDMIVNSDTTNGNSGITIRDMTLNGNRANNASAMDGIVFNRVGPSTGVAATPSAIVTGMNIINFAGVSISMQNANNNRISDNSFASTTGVGIGMNIGVNNLISNNSFSDVEAAVEFDDVDGSIITGNSFDLGNSASGTVGIESGSNVNTISNNVFRDSADTALRIATSNNNTIIANTFENNGGSGTSSTILIDGNSNYTRIIDNKILDTAGTGYAINIANVAADETVLEGNSFSGTGATTINDAGTNTIYEGQIDVSGNYVIDPMGSISLQANTNITGTLGVSGATTLSGGLTVTSGGNVAYQRNTTNYTATGTQDNVNFGTGALFRITSASAVTINGISGGADGRIITLMNASSNTVTLGNNASGTAANHIITGTGGNISLLAGASLKLMYDSASSVWRVIGSGSGIGGGSYVTLQGSTPGTADTGNLNISGTGVFGTALRATNLDRSNAGTLSIGDANATTINIATNALGHTINIGTSSTGSQTVNIGATANSSYLFLGAGSGGALMDVDGSVAIDFNGIFSVGNQSSVDYFRIDNATGTATFTYDSSLSVLGSASFDKGISMTNSAYVTYASPLGTNFNTFLSLSNASLLGAANTAISLGINSNSHTSARGILVADARTSAHEASIGVMNADETDVLGFSWEGNNSTGYIKTSNGSSLGIRLNATDVATFGASAITFTQDTDINGDLTLDFNNTATTNGVCHSGANSNSTATDRSLVVCSGAPNDYAEFYPAEQGVEAGDVVATTPNMLTYEAQGADPETGVVHSMGTKQISILKKAQAGDSTIGIVSTAPYQTIGRDIPVSANRKPIALNGRVPVKVNNQGGPIAAGDVLTISTMPGYATKATTAGKTIAVALEPFSGTTGSIMVYVESGYYEPPVNTMLQGEQLNITGDAVFNGSVNVGGALNVTGPVTINDLTVTGNAVVQGGLTVIGTLKTANIIVGGHVLSQSSAPTAVAGAASGAQGIVSIDGTDVAGTVTVTVAAGSNTTLTAGSLVDVTFNKAYEFTPRIVITPMNQSSVNAPVYIVKTSNGYSLMLSQPATEGTQYQFDYVIVGSNASN